MSDVFVIDFKNANIFQEEKLILESVNLQLKHNEFVYIIGKVGSGKTSLIKTINAELPLQKGTGNIAGFQLSMIRRRQIPLLRRKIGIVYQDYKLLSDRNVYKNMLFILQATGWQNKKEAKNRILEVLALTNMEGFENKLPYELSGGEQQRMVIARALLNSPEIILADEPTGNLDPETSYSLVQLLMDISKRESCVIIATHQYDLLKKFPARTFKCENKKLIEISES